MQKTPLVSVIMSVYNAQKYIREAIDSILNQTFSNFEFIIINDGSTDNTKNIILNYTDHRIKLSDNEQNIGLAASLNKGIKLAKGKYIARMDADDISLPERFEVQYNFMEENPDVDICGTWFKKFGDQNGFVKLPINNEDIKLNLLKYASLAHPTVFFKRKKIFATGIFYDNKFRIAQDYKLWTDLAFHFTMQNIPEVLLHYRWHSENTNYKQTQKNKAQIEQIRINYLKNLLNIPGDNDNIKKVSHIIKTPTRLNHPISFINKYYQLLLHENRINKYFCEEKLIEFLGKSWQIQLFKQKKYHPKLLKYICSPFYTDLSIKATGKFIVKCLIYHKVKY